MYEFKGQFLITNLSFVIIPRIESIYREVIAENKNKAEKYFFVLNMKSGEQHYIFFPTKKEAQDCLNDLIKIQISLNS